MFELISQICIAQRRMVSYIYILLKLLSGWFKWRRNPSTPAEKGGNDLARHKLYLALHCSLMSLKTEAQKKEYFEYLKVAHDKFSWKEIRCIGRYGGHSWQVIWLRGWMHEWTVHSVQGFRLERLYSKHTVLRDVNQLCYQKQYAKHAT